MKGYVLDYMRNGYELAFMSINMHLKIWIFIDAYIDEIEYMLQDTVDSYLEFCKQTGVSHLTLNTYGQTLVNDLHYVFSSRDDENE